MNIKNWRELSFLLLMIASILWIILSFTAMLFYTGGTYADPKSPGYDFFSNMNSDLGRTVAHSGKPNTISFIIFVINHLIFAISFILFNIAIFHFFIEEKIAKKLSLIGSLFGIIVGIGFIGAVLAPSDVNHEIHLLFTNIAVSALIFFVLFYCIAIYLHEEYSNFYSYVYLAYIILVVIYLIVWFLGPSFSTSEGVRIQATWQKILFFAGMISIFIQSYGAWKLETS